MPGDELVVLWGSLLQDSDIHVVDYHLWNSLLYGGMLL